MTDKPKIIVLGDAEHGKDAACEILEAEHGFRFTSSSVFCSEKVVYPVLAPLYGYGTVRECFDDRRDHRTEWYDLIMEYNREDPAKLVKEMFVEHDVYCGLRNSRELHSARNQGIVDFVLWVDASHIRPRESRDSNTVEPWMADFVVDNNVDWNLDKEAASENLRRSVGEVADAMMRKMLWDR